MSAAPDEHQLVTITVPADIAAAVKARVESGEFADQGEVVRNGLRLLTEEDTALHDPEVERWLATIATPIAEATVADPSRSIQSAAVRAQIEARRASGG